MMKQKRVFLSAVLTLVLLCSFILPVFAASYQNGDTAKVTVSSVWAFHAGRQPGKTVPPATVATGATITTTACIGSRAIPSTSCKWTEQVCPAVQRQNVLLLHTQMDRLRHKQPKILCGSYRAWEPDDQPILEEQAESNPARPAHVDIYIRLSGQNSPAAWRRYSR